MPFASERFTASRSPCGVAAGDFTRNHRASKDIRKRTPARQRHVRFAKAVLPAVLLWQLVSVIGSWLHQMAETLLVYSITDSGIAVGLVMASRYAPVLTLGLWGGKLADRYDRRRLLLVTQALRGMCAGILGVLALADMARPSVVCLLAFLAGVSNAIDNPVRRAFISQLVNEGSAHAVSLTSRDVRLTVIARCCA